MNKKINSILIGLISVATFLPLSIAVNNSIVLARNEESFEPENYLSVDNYNVTKETIIKREGDFLNIQGAATYKLPFDFEQNTSKRIKLKFTINSTNPNSESFVVFHSNPDDIYGGVDGDKPGLYLKFKNNNFTSYTFDTFYSDGINYKAEMMGGTLTRKENINFVDHTIQLETSLVDGYTDGIRLFYQGSHFGDWLGYSMVKNKKLTKNNNIYFSIAGDVSITRIVARDVVAPKITYTEPESPIGYASEEYKFGEIDVLDDIDGYVPFTTQLLNEEKENISEKLYYKDDGMYFKPLSKGTYTLRITASDYSYNVSSKRYDIVIDIRPHYPYFTGDIEFPSNGRQSMRYYFPKLKAVDLTEDGLPQDDNMTYFYSGYILDTSNQQHPVTINNDEDGYYFIPKEMEAYNDGIGQYYLTIEARNSYGSSYVEQDVWIKYDLTSPDSYILDNIYNKSNWNYNKINDFREDGIYIAGPTYYKAALKLEDGIKINFSVLDLPDKSKQDSWFSISLLKQPSNAKYMDPKCGLQFMFFYQQNSLRYNIIYVQEDGSYFDIKNNDVLYTQIPEYITLAINPFDVSLDPSMYDNITISFDGNQVESFETTKVKRSKWTDDEGFVYLAMSNFNDRDNHESSFDLSNNPKVRINSIALQDKTKPVITVKDFPTHGKVGETIILPKGSATDDIDGEVETHLISVKNEQNKKLTIINNKLIPNSAGEYTVTYSATDSSGNTSTIDLKITIEQNANILLIVLISVGAILLISGITAFIILRKKKQHD